MNLGETKILVDETAGGVLDDRPIAATYSYRRSPFTPLPLIPLSSTRSFPRAPFLFSRIYSSVHERSRAFTELEHLPPRYYLY